MAEPRERFDKAAYLYGNLLDVWSSLPDVFREFPPDAIVHCAAQARVDPSLTDPFATYDANTVGTLNLLKFASLQKPPPLFVYLSSEAIYGQADHYPTKETDHFRPINPYAASKIACVFATTKIFTEKGVKLAKDIATGDLVWTHKGRLRKVIRTFKRLHNGKVITVRAGAGHHGIRPFPTNCQSSFTEEHPVLTTRGWIAADKLSDSDLVAVPATRCEICDGRIPYFNRFCSQACTSRGTANTRSEKIASIMRLREQRTGVLQKALVESRKNGSWHRKVLGRRGMNLHEYYLNLLIQAAVPGVFSFVGDGKAVVSGHCPDWICEHRKLIIEYEGYPEKLRSKSDRILSWKEAGYRVLLLSEIDFRNPERVRVRLGEFLLEQPELAVRMQGFTEMTFRSLQFVKRFRLKKPLPVYNFEVEEDNSYIAGGIAVHNCDVMVQQLNGRLGMRTCVLRSGMGMGPRSPPKAQVVSRFIVRCLEDKPLLFPVRFGAHPTRDINPVWNFVDGVRLVLEARATGVYNIATGRELSIFDVAQKVVDAVGRGSVLSTPDFSYREGEDGMRTCLDIGKARDELGYEPRLTFEDALRPTIEWFKQWKDVYWVKA